MKTFNARLGAWALLLSVFGLPFAPVLSAQTFTNVTDTAIPGLLEGRTYSMAWGDFDNDGRLDLLLESYFTITNHPDPQTTSTYNVPRPLLWRNTGNGFTNMPDMFAPGLSGIFVSSVTWADYDNDGHLDFLVIGERFNVHGDGYYAYVAELWRNTGNGFSNVTATVAPDLPASWRSSVAWGDYDNDGRMDFLLVGSFVSQIWRNTGSNFVNVTDTVAPGLAGVSEGAAAWGDYDNDGRLDLIITGGIPRRSDLDDDYPYYAPISQIWRNTGSRFENVTPVVAPGLPGVFWGSVGWGDYDNDGRLDLLLTGSTHSGGFSQLWRNTGSNFVNVTASIAPGLPAIIQGPLAWGDYDNDGRLDMLLSGQIWRNTDNGFTNVTATVAPGLSTVVSSSLAWGDYNNDGRLDFLLTGSTYFYCDGCDSPPHVSQLWQNNTAQSNPPPTVITKVPSIVSDTSVALNSSINPRNQDATAWFVWSNSTNYGQVTAAQPIGNGNSLMSFSQAISGLSTGVTYYYRAVASNAQGVVLGVEQRFVLAAPGVTTSSMGEFRPNTATIKAYATPNNLPTWGWFEWGFTPVLGQVTPVQFLGNGFDATLSQDLYGLAIGTNVYFRAVVSNSVGMAYGATQSLVMIDAPSLCPASSLSPSSKSLGYAGGSGYSVHALLPCRPWIVINTNSWITITSPTNGTALESSVTFNVAANTDPQPRSGNIMIGGHNFLVTQGGGNPGCTTYISPTTENRGYGAETETVYVSAPPTCVWDVVNTNSWITIVSGTNGIGNGQVVYDIDANPGTESRTGKIMIGGRVHTLTQDGHYVVSRPADQIVALGGTATFSAFANTNFGTPPFTYCWQFNGVDLVNGSGISGANTTNLVLTDVQYSQAGHYRLSVSNANGTPFYFSSSATLTVAPTSHALSIAEALDTDDMFFWKTWSDSTGIWFGQTNTTFDGFDALEASGLSSGQYASVETKSGGPGILNFWWKTDFATPADRLYFWIGSWQAATLTNTTDWEQRTFTVPPGDVNLRWTLSKYSSTGEQTKAWLDQIEFTPCDFRLSQATHYPPDSFTFGSMAATGSVTLTAAADCPWNVVNTNSWITILSSVTNHGSGLVTYAVVGNPTPTYRSGVILIADQIFSVYQNAGSSANNPVISLPEALDTEGSMTWSTIGTPAWFGQKTISRDGVDAAQSGSVRDNGAVTAVTTADGPGTVLFWWKVSSETNKDYLKFFINGVQQTRISGETDWQFMKYDLTSVTNTLKWTYSKNNDEAVGQDRGWLDQVQFIPASQTGGCVLAISPISAAHSASSETDTVYVITAAGCDWNVVNTNSWITYVASPSESNGLVRYTVSANNSRNSRTGVMVIAGRFFTVTQAAGLPPCSYSISPLSRTHGYGSSTGMVTVTTQSDCNWNVTTPNAWITILSNPGNTDSGQLIYSIPQNTSSIGRTGQVFIGNQIFTITQSAGPAPTLAEALDTVGTPLVWTTGDLSGNWQWFGETPVSHDGVDAARSAPITQTGASTILKTTVSGPGTLTFWWKTSAKPPYDGLHFFINGNQQDFIGGETDWQQRTFVFSSGAQLQWMFWHDGGSSGSPGQDCGWLDQVQFVPGTNSGCNITISPAVRAHGYASGSNFVTVAAGTGCAWYVINTNTWITITSPTNGSGSGVVNYTVAANTSPSPRSGSVIIGGKVFTATQSGGPSNGCTSALSPAGGVHSWQVTTGTVAVTTQPGCAWTVLSTNYWISILSGLSSSNSGTVVYQVTQNTNTQSRAGNINIGGQNFAVYQTGLSSSNFGPRIQLTGWRTNSSTLRIETDTGRIYVVECSDDLIHWVRLSTNSSPATVTDTSTTNALRRFYRTYELP